VSAPLNEIDELLDQYDQWENEYDAVASQICSDYTPDLPEKPRFEVKDKSSAEWVMRKIAKLEGQIEENDHIALEQIKVLEEEIEQVKGWAYGENQKAQKHIEFLKSQLYPYHLMILEADPKAKTIKLPHGKMEIRSQQPEIKRDDETLLDWLNGEALFKFVKVEQSPDWQALKQNTTIDNGKFIYTETGQVIEGVVAVNRPDKFTVTTKQIVRADK